MRSSAMVTNKFRMRRCRRLSFLAAAAAVALIGSSLPNAAAAGADVKRHTMDADGSKFDSDGSRSGSSIISSRRSKQSDRRSASSRYTSIDELEETYFDISDWRDDDDDILLHLTKKEKLARHTVRSNAMDAEKKWWSWSRPLLRHDTTSARAGTSSDEEELIYFEEEFGVHGSLLENMEYMYDVKFDDEKEENDEFAVVTATHRRRLLPSNIETDSTNKNAPGLSSEQRIGKVVGSDQEDGVITSHIRGGGKPKS